MFLVGGKNWQVSREYQQLRLVWGKSVLRSYGWCNRGFEKPKKNFRKWENIPYCWNSGLQKEITLRNLSVWNLRFLLKYSDWIFIFPADLKMNWFQRIARWFPTHMDCINFVVSTGMKKKTVKDFLWGWIQSWKISDRNLFFRRRPRLEKTFVPFCCSKRCNPIVLISSPLPPKTLLPVSSPFSWHLGDQKNEYKYYLNKTCIFSILDSGAKASIRTGRHSSWLLQWSRWSWWSRWPWWPQWP